MSHQVNSASNLSQSVAYLPVREFYAKMSQRKSPYQCKFSFEPFFEKIKNEANTTPNQLPDAFTALMEEVENQLKSITDEDFLRNHPEKIEKIIHFLFPNLFLVEKLGFIKVPFAESFAYITKDMQALLDSEDWEIKIPDFLGGKNKQPSVSFASEQDVGTDANIHHCNRR